MMKNEFLYTESCVILYRYGFGGVGPISNAGFQFQNIKKEQMILETQFVTYLYI